MQTPLSKGVWLSRSYSAFLVGVALTMRLPESLGLYTGAEADKFAREEDKCLP